MNYFAITFAVNAPENAFAIEVLMKTIEITRAILQQ